MFCFEITVDSPAVVRNNRAVPDAPCSVASNDNILKNVAHYDNQDIDIDEVKMRNTFIRIPHVILL